MKKGNSIKARLKKLNQLKSEAQLLVKDLGRKMKAVVKSLEKANEVLGSLQGGLTTKRRQVRRSKGKKARRGRTIRRRGKKLSAKQRAAAAPAAEAQQS